MKKFIALLLALVFMAAIFALPAGAVGFEPPFEISGKAAYIVNTDTNIIVYEKNSEESLPAASLTKIMTCILLVEQYEDQLDTVTAELTASIRDSLYGQGMASADILMGEPHTLRSLMYAALVPSAADAAMIIANTVSGGSIDNFVYMMNSKAKEIGCSGTTFVDPVGMSLENVTTARDMYLILRYALSFDTLKEAMSTLKWDMGQDYMPSRYSSSSPYMLYSTNKMHDKDLGAEYYRDYNQGGKTGSLGEWQNFAGWHSKDGENYISVVLNVPNGTDPDGGRPALLETGTLMDWVYETYTIAPALDTTQPITESRIVYSTQTDTVMLYPADDMMTLLPREGGAALTEQVFNLPDHLTAPLKQGDVVGTVTLTIGGESIGTVDLIAGSDVARNQMLYTISRVGEFFSSTYFKVVIMLTMAVVAVYAFVWVLSILGVWSRESEDKS